MKYTFNDHWLTETLRLRESFWGPIDDASETGKARAQPGDFEARLLVRNRLLATREGLDTALQRWYQIARLVLLAFSAFAIVAGGAIAVAALGSDGRPVNLTLAVVTLLGLNTLTLLFWLASFGLQAGATGSLLADAWLGLTRRLARGPDAALLPRSLLEIMTRTRLSRWAAGALSHWLWALALVSAFITLLALLAARRYTFQWETTVLSPDAFVWLVHTLGWLPSALGFPQPMVDTIRASGGQAILPGDAHALWSGWLLGVVAVYGVLPRIVALLLSLFVVRRRAGNMRVDTSLPGLIELHERLMPASLSTGIDAPAPGAQTAQLRSAPADPMVSARRLLGLELPADLAWPPAALNTGIQDLGVIETREQRHRVLEQLRQQPAQRLLACCDARQTPDRGTVALLTELATLSAELGVLLLPDDGTAARREQWLKQLLQAGFQPEQLLPYTGDALAWLTAEAGKPPAGGASEGTLVQGGST